LIRVSMALLNFYLVGYTRLESVRGFCPVYWWFGSEF
jgi:hypothetical protein